MTRWAYISQNDLAASEANVKQSLETVSHLCVLNDTDFLCAPFERAGFERARGRFGIDEASFVRPLGEPLRSSTRLAEWRSRWQWSRAVVEHLVREPHAALYTRDFGFLVYLALSRSRRLLLAPLIYEPHKIYCRTNRSVPRALEALALRGADFFTPISRGIAEELVRDLGVRVERIEVIPNAASLPPESTEPLDDVEREFRILYSGSFLRWKGVDVLLDAVDEWAGEGEWRLVLCGGNRQDESRILDRIARSKVRERIEWMGFLDAHDLDRELRTASVAVLPNTAEANSIHYTSPLKLFEYLAHGVPIVAADLPSLREILGRENAIFFTPGDPTALANALRNARADRALREGQRRKNRRLAREHTWAKRAEKIAKVIARMRREASL